MRIEPAPYVFWNDERRQRADDRRMAGGDRREAPTVAPRARHAAYAWFASAFGAQILGQIAPAVIVPARARLAYTQPEARTPPRPRVERSA
jgi:hypothetical protein